MKGMIDSGGYLRIWRLWQNPQDKAPRRACPFALQMMRACGDWCPLFGEPVDTPAGTELQICQAKLVFSDFSYERKLK